MNFLETDLGLVRLWGIINSFYGHRLFVEMLIEEIENKIDKGLACNHAWQDEKFKVHVSEDKPHHSEVLWGDHPYNGLYVEQSSPCYKYEVIC